jgi:hypothetical protein
MHHSAARMKNKKFDLLFLFIGMLGLFQFSGSLPDFGHR